MNGYWPESDLAESRRLMVNATLHKTITYESIARIVGERMARR